MMRYVYTPHIDEIPQWKQCYYDYNILNQVQNIINEYSSVYQDTEQLLLQYRRYRQKYNTQSQHLYYLPESNSVYSYQQLQSYKHEIYRVMSKWCLQFTKYSYKCSTIVTMFVKMRHLQIQTKFQQYKRLYNIVKSQRSNILLLLENLYLENIYLSKAIAFNITQQIKIGQKYEKFSIKYQQHYKVHTQNKFLRRLKKINDVTLSSIEQNYLIVSSQRQNKAFQILHEVTYNYKEVSTKNWQLMLVGVAMGCLVLMVTVLIITDYVNNIILEDDTIFINHFPIWRGASYILFYLWILSIDILFYERSQINYPLIFQFKDHYMPSSKYILLRASILSIIYIVLFYMFTLQIGQKIGTRFYHYGAIFWAILIFQLFANRIISLAKSRKNKGFFFYKMLVKIIFTPCITISFLIIWVTEQLSSFNQPFGDFFYTICSVTNGNYSFCSTHSAYASTTYILFIFLYRMIQNLKIWHQNTMQTADKKYDFKAGPFVGFFRGLLSFITTIFALLNRLNAFHGIFAIWLTFSIITTLFSWFIDIKYDWGIFDRKSKNFLRQKLLFPQAKFIYYFFAIFNLVLRTAWVLTISNLIIINKGFPQLIFVMIISYLQIFRRGVWNILRIQNQHIKNCGEFKATITDRDILQQIQQKAKQKQKIIKNMYELNKKRLSNDADNINSGTHINSNVNILEILIDYNDNQKQLASHKKIQLEHQQELENLQMNQKQEKNQMGGIIKQSQNSSDLSRSQYILNNRSGRRNKINIKNQQTNLAILEYMQKIRQQQKKLAQKRKKQTKQVFKQHLHRKSEMKQSIIASMQSDYTYLQQLCNKVQSYKSYYEVLLFQNKLQYVSNSNIQNNGQIN